MADPLAEATFATVQSFTRALVVVPFKAISWSSSETTIIIRSCYIVIDLYHCRVLVTMALTYRISLKSIVYIL